MTLDFVLVRANERLQCDWFVWLDTIELAKAFGWKPKSPNLSERWLSKLMRDPILTEVTDEDAHSLAVAIRECLIMFSANKRPTRKQLFGLMRFYRKTDRAGNSMLFSIDEPTRIAKFCKNGGFRMTTAAPENR
jgi:hypothetical protein